MARKRNPNRGKAHELWLKDKERPLVDIAKELNERPSTIRKWKSQDNWERSESKESAPIKKERSVKANDPRQLVIENDELTEQQKMFCLYYLQSFNATKAYQQAYKCDYNVANANGSRLLVKASVKAELHRLKAELQQDVMVDIKDIMKEYARQAFSDIKDYVEFGTEIETVELETPIVTDKIDENGVPIVQTTKEYKRSFVRLKNHDEVDGLLIQEVKKGKDGVSVKLYDKQKAMNELLKYLDVTSDVGNRVVFVDAEDEMLKYMKENAHEYDNIDK